MHGFVRSRPVQCCESKFFLLKWNQTKHSHFFSMLSFILSFSWIGWGYYHTFLATKTNTLSVVCSLYGWLFSTYSHSVLYKWWGKELCVCTQRIVTFLCVHFIMSKSIDLINISINWNDKFLHFDSFAVGWNANHFDMLFDWILYNIFYWYIHINRTIQ